MHKQALAHLRAADPHLSAVIEKVGDCAFEARAEGTHLGAVARAIVYQQLSGKAAGTIHRRFEELYGGRAPTAEELLATPDDRLRSVGLSRQKTSYLKDLAARVVAGEVPIESLDTLTDDEVVDALVRVKGVGRWTAQMFLMFRLGRPDVLPDLDLGVQKGLQLAHGLKSLPKPRDVMRLGAAWAPYRSIASWYLWRLLDNGDGQGTKVVAAAAERAAKTKRPASPKSSARKVSARLPTAKKSTAKKSSVNKSTAKKSTAKKSVAKKTVARKTTARKSGARQSSRATAKRRRPTKRASEARAR